MGSVAAGAVAATHPVFGAAPLELATGRPAKADRKFSSPAVDTVIADVSKQIADPQLAAMFECCLPNTLDTTVFAGSTDGKPDTFVITGDIDAMWLRDSSAQVWPYLQFAQKDKHLAEMLEGLVRRHARSILIDPYANAFTRTTSDPPLSWARNDATTMTPGVAERKWEADSLCQSARLAHGYWKSTGDTNPFDSTWKAAAWKTVETFREQLRLTDRGPYSFQRASKTPADSLTLRGYGNPARSVGMIYSMFRPSDDACIYPLFVPANLFAVQALTALQELAVHVVNDARLASACQSLAESVQIAVIRYGTVEHREFGKIWAYEVDGYGNALMMDDAGLPSLLGLPYLNVCALNDPLYQRTRRFVLSSANPYFFKGTAAEGVGSPHVDLSYVWPMSIIVQALTSSDDREIVQCLRWLRDTTAGTQFIHEAFLKNNPEKFTRPWFAWANTLFGELILTLAEKKPGILRAAL